jgi:PST family polysaccharide transporter
MQPKKGFSAQLLRRITRWNAVHVLAKTFSAFCAAKWYALFLGPMGMAHLGNFRNLLAEWEVLVTLGLENSLIQSLSKPELTDHDRSRLLSTCLALIAATGVFVLLGSALGWHWMESAVLHDAPVSSYFWICCLSLLPFYWAQLYLGMVLNGLGQTVSYFKAASWGSVLNLLVTYVLVSQFGLSGAMISLVAYPVFLLTWYVYVLNKMQAFRLFTFQSIELTSLKPLLTVSAMSILAAIWNPIIQWYIRDQLMLCQGLEAAGYWEALNRISSFLFLFVGSVTTYYFLPMLVRGKSNRERNIAFRRFYFRLFPLFLAGLVILWLGRSLWVPFLFSDAFDPIESAMKWQFAGDGLRAASLIWGYLFFAEKRWKSFLFFELASGLLWMYSSTIGIQNDGLEGALKAYTFTYLIYGVAVCLYFTYIASVSQKD